MYRRRISSPHCPAPRSGRRPACRVLPASTADQDVVDGARDDAHATCGGLCGDTDEGTRGNRLLVAHPEAAVTHAAVTFRDGRRATADV